MPPSENRSTSDSQFVKAPREVVYQAFLDPQAVAQWLAPDTMQATVDQWEPRAGGKIRMSLTYTEQQDFGTGKSSDNTDTSEGRFIELVPNERIAQVFEFESDDPAFEGEMRMTWTLADADGGTNVTVLCEDIPAGIRLEDNKEGSQQTLKKLAAYVEQGTA